VDEVEGYGDVAYVIGRYAMTLEPEGASEPVDDEGKYIEIRRKQPDGGWLMSRDIFNSDRS
jgi:ketosteroid isomerase-like protein